MEHSEEFEQAIQSFSNEIKEIARQTRKLIYKVLPEVVEVVWIRQKNIGFGTGPKKKTEHFCWVMPATNHVNLGFNYGAELPDPKNLLEGTGKLFRHYKVKSVKELSNPDLIKILKYSTTYKIPPINTK
ncbi:DUF1801 domain-containing protein [Gelidibacter gilvus]|uniref:DUF1801 domain-containing protein n=1 Tax=Gelidibacter gilvus TaxID=59602 RepID=A0A4Q0XCW4_9FLAO|nr:DUF1801 domain-containing protein [Gelidibacter gilvus]RXJ45772.1 DUF1801 domain-containing protein [Gelidibacter gilvus]